MSEIISTIKTIKSDHRLRKSRLIGKTNKNIGKKER